MYHIENDNKAGELMHYAGKDLPWTLYDGLLSYNFYATREQAERDFKSIVDDQREEVVRAESELEEEEDLLAELEATKI